MTYATAAVQQQARWTSAILIPFVTIAVSTTLAVAAKQMFDGRWVHEPTHSAIETMGAMVALVIAVLLLWARDLYADPPLDWVSAALLVQGLLDLTHAFTRPGPAFFWSRALPTLLGGMLFAATWITPPKRRATLLTASLCLALGLAVGLLAWPSKWPVAFSETGVYSAWAKSLNVAGGCGFLAGAAFFSRRQARQGLFIDRVFASHSALFGAAGFVFWVARLWDTSWWLLHFLRLLAYVVSLAYIVDVGRRMASLRDQQFAAELDGQYAELLALRQQLKTHQRSE